MDKNLYHVSVLLEESMEFLKIEKDKWYIDGTLGGGGHTKRILERGGQVLGIDQDREAILEVARKYGLKVEDKDNGLHAVSENLILVHDNFSNILKIKNKFLKDERIFGILLDLGVSSYQLENAERGFSFRFDAPLDMRMDQSSIRATAADLINGLHEKELTELFIKLGEESFARPIAKKIVQERVKSKIETTGQLAHIVESVKRKRPGDKIHPATKVFQALRIVVNDELNSLKTGLEEAFDILEIDGRIVIITFHSLEDRIVKTFFREKSYEGEANLLTKKPVEPSTLELEQNPRSRSAKLRAVEKV